LVLVLLWQPRLVLLLVLPLFATAAEPYPSQ